MRIDKWLWSARFFKTQADATRCVASGRMRLDGEPMSKPHRQVRPGHVLTFAKGDDIRVIKIVAMASRRGPQQKHVCFTKTSPRLNHVSVQEKQRRDLLKTVPWEAVAPPSANAG